MKPQFFSRLYPCQVRFSDGWCAGIAALRQHPGRGGGEQLFKCTKCAATWDRDGHPHTTSNPKQGVTNA